MKFPTILALFLLSLTGIRLHGADPWFPYEAGKYFEYEAKVFYVDPGAETAVDRQLKWRARVEGVLQAGDFQVALILGDPSQLAWFDEFQPPRFSLVVMDGEGRIYEVDRGAELIFHRLKAGENAEQLLRPELTGFAHIMSKEMALGDVFQVEEGEEVAQPGRYSTVVEEVLKTRRVIVEELMEGAAEESFLLTHRTNPDHTSRTFTPGLGLTAYVYEHHGTPGDVECALVGVGLDPAGAKPAGVIELGPPLDEDKNKVLGSSFVKRFLDCSADDDRHEELLAMFADEVDYFGERKTRAEIAEHEIDYLAKWPFRSLSLSLGGFEVNRPLLGRADIDYTMEWVSASLERSERKTGRVRMRMTVREPDWEIIALKSLDKPEDEFPIVMGERFGPVTRDTSLKDLTEEVGADNIHTQTYQNFLEDIEETVSTVYGGSDREFQVFWDEGRPIRVHVNRNGTPYETPAGITIGSGLRGLIDTNEGDFTIFGFGWDYGGMLGSWNGGKLARDHAVGHFFQATFNPGDPPLDEAAYEKVLGDGLFSTRLEELRTLDPTVSEMIFYFPEQRWHIGGLHLDLGEFFFRGQLLEEPEKGEDELWGADGLHHQEWRWPKRGVTLDMAHGDGGVKAVASITVESPCWLETEMGIGIGDTWAEVALAYADQFSPEDSKEGEIFVAGSIYGGLIFQFEDGKVSQIFLGAAAE